MPPQDDDVWRQQAIDAINAMEFVTDFRIEAEARYQMGLGRTHVYRICVEGVAEQAPTIHGFSAPRKDLGPDVEKADADLARIEDQLGG